MCDALPHDAELGRGRTEAQRVGRGRGATFAGARMILRKAIWCAVEAALVLAFLCLAGCGFVHRGADGGFTVITLFKDLNFKGKVEAAADGTKKIEGEASSSVNSDAIHAAAEGAAAGAVKAVKVP
jgi:hypothetical protein